MAKLKRFKKVASVDFGGCASKDKEYAEMLKKIRKHVGECYGQR